MSTKYVYTSQRFLVHIRIHTYIHAFCRSTIYLCGPWLYERQCRAHVFKVHAHSYTWWVCAFFLPGPWLYERRVLCTYLPGSSRPPRARLALNRATKVEDTLAPGCVNVCIHECMHHGHEVEGSLAHAWVFVYTPEYEHINYMHQPTAPQFLIRNWVTTKGGKIYTCMCMYMHIVYIHMSKNVCACTCT